MVQGQGGEVLFRMMDIRRDHGLDFISQCSLWFRHYKWVETFLQESFHCVSLGYLKLAIPDFV